MLVGVTDRPAAVPPPQGTVTDSQTVLLPSAREALLLQHGRATRVRYLDQAGSVPWSPPR